MFAEEAPMDDFQLTDLKRRLYAETTSHFFGYMKDPDTDEPVLLADILTLTITLWWGNKDRGKAINNRNEQNALNTNNVTYNATSGLLDFHAQQADTTMQSKDPGVLEEEHFFYIKWTWNSPVGTQAGGYKDCFIVYREPTVTG
jgi:hypothetical protein